MMDKNCYFFSDLPYTKEGAPEWFLRAYQFSQENACRTYLIRFPFIDTERTIYDSNFLLLMTGYKICIIQESNDQTYNEYKEDVLDAISYLYVNYNYRKQLGLLSAFRENILKSEVKCSELSDFDAFVQGIRLEDPKDKRNASILISLCVGSINDINTIGSDLPVTTLDKVKRKIQLFDGDQTRFIYGKLDQKCIRIQGLSGTGKTELLFHKLKELYIENDTNKIFFTCHNHVLASLLKKRIEKFFNDMKVGKQISWNERLWCANAWGKSMNPNSGLYVYICSKYEIPFQSYGMSSDFDRVCKNALENLEKIQNFEPCLDYIFIDESQDFKGNFFKLCDKVARKRLYIAGDVFQTIFSDSIEEAKDADFFLSKCYRTAPNTLMFAHALELGLFESRKFRWLTDDGWHACGYTTNKQDGVLELSREPIKRFDEDIDKYESVIICQTNNVISQISAIIESIKQESNDTLTPDDIAILLVDREAGIYNLATQLAECISNKYDWQVNIAHESKQKIPNTVFLSNRNNVKGLEFPYVICVTNSIQDDYSYRNAIYMALTRSFIKSYLVVTGPNSIKKEIADGWNEINETGKIKVKIPQAEEIQSIELAFNQAKQNLSLRDIIDSNTRDLMLSNADKQRLAEKMIDLEYEKIPTVELGTFIRTLVKTI
jgi:superfamily I DNA and RNA helicase